MDLEAGQSDVRITMNSSFVPVKYDKDKVRGGNVRFKVEKTVELDDDYRVTPKGGFFFYINPFRVDLRLLQIFLRLNKKNYKDNCFVYACIQSRIFNDEEINHL